VYPYQAQGTDVVITTGLAAGERIVIEAPAELADGATVTDKKS